MPADPPNGTQREIGILIGRMDAVMNRLDRFENSVSQQLDRADAKRGKLYERIERIDENMASIDGRVMEVEGKVDVMMPAVDVVNNLKGKAGGFVLGLGILGGLLIWFAYAFTDQLKAAIIRFFAG